MSAVVRINGPSAMHVQIRYTQIKQRYPRWTSFWPIVTTCWDNHENSSTSTNYNIERYIGVIDSYKRFTSLQRREHKALISHASDTRHSDLKEDKLFNTDYKYCMVQHRCWINTGD